MALIPLLFQFPTLPSVHCLFPLRDLEEVAREPNNPYAGGNLSFEVGEAEEKVCANRKALLLAMAPLGLKRLTDVHQVHGTKLLFEPASLPEAKQAKSPLHPLPLDADGMVTDASGTGLYIKTADCQSLLFAETQGTHLMALHVGWRGNRDCFIQKAVSAFLSAFNLTAKDLLVVRGPSLGRGRAEFINAAREWPKEFLPFYDPKTKSMDLWELTRSQLLETGIPKQSIFTLDLCTMSLNSLFSYRRDRICGRLGGIIWKE